MSLNEFHGIVLEMVKLYPLLYADDIILFSDSETGLQNGRDTLKTYCDKWKLSVNVTKTEVMFFFFFFFRKSGKISNSLSFTYSKKKHLKLWTFFIPRCYFCLGGSFNCTFEIIEGQAIKAISALKQYLPVFKDISVSHTLELFDKLIFPILIYEGEVWGFSEAEALEKIHTRFCKQVLNVKLQTPNNFIYGELGWLPLKELRLLYIIKFWLKITRADDRKYIERMYNQMLYDADYSTNRNNWASKVKKIFYKQLVSHTFGWIKVLKMLQFLKMFLHKELKIFIYKIGTNNSTN